MLPNTELQLSNQRDQRGVVPANLLKLRQMGTHVVQMKWVLVGFVMSVYGDLAALVRPVQNI
jgi:hypothetical protein